LEARSKATKALEANHLLLKIHYEIYTYTLSKLKGPTVTTKWTDTMINNNTFNEDNNKEALKELRRVNSQSFLLIYNSRKPISNFICEKSDFFNLPGLLIYEKK